jgi:hypothetical protein
MPAKQPTRPLPSKAHERFWAKVQKTDDVWDCWEWIGGHTTAGYGIFGLSYEIPQYAHRISWELLVGLISDGLEVDHLCRNRSCVNPCHLEPVTPAENRRRGVPHREPKLWCAKGHVLLFDNLRIDSKGHRSCVECTRERVPFRDNFPCLADTRRLP